MYSTSAEGQFCFMLERRSVSYKAHFVLSCGKRGEWETKPEALRAVQNVASSSACLWQGHFWMNEETAQNETHIKVRAYWSRESFWKKSLLAWLPPDCKGRHLPIRQNLCYGILPLPCLCFLLGEEAKCWNYHSNKYREFSPETTYLRTRRTSVGSIGGCTLHRF